MAEIPPYPPIDPTTFDLIVIGTGLPESVIAASASAAGKTVLHLDPNHFYGSHFASLTLHDLESFLNSHSSHTDPPSSSPTDDQDYTAVDLTPRRLYSDVEISPYAPEIVEQHSRKFNLDVSGPRALFCADKAIDLVLKSGANQYIEFKSVDACFVCSENGKLVNVPDSRAAIFKDKSLSLLEKNQLMKFFKLVQGHIGSTGEEDGPRISEEDLASPFVDFLKKMRLPPKIKSIILYAIAMADYDQENVDVCKFLLKTEDGIDRLALYHASVGRFQNALGALIYPIYGQGELPQAFCRRAAVKGSIYVLRMPVNAVLVDKDSGNYKGVRLASGQDLFSQKLVLDPSFTDLSPLPTPENLQGSLVDCCLRDVKWKVARGICITRSSLKPGVSNLLVVYPPRSLLPEQVTSVRALQIGSSLAVCPAGMFVLYLSVLCEDAKQGKKFLSEAMKAIFTLPDSGNSEINSGIENENTEEVKPILLWSAMYVQEFTMGQCGPISYASMPDGSLNYNNMLDSTRELFEKMYPDEEFFKETTSPENPEDGAGLSSETSPDNPEDGNGAELSSETPLDNPEDGKGAELTVEP